MYSPIHPPKAPIQGNTGKEQTTNRRKWVAELTPLPSPGVQAQHLAPGSTIIYGLHNENTREKNVFPVARF